MLSYTEILTHPNVEKALSRWYNNHSFMENYGNFGGRMKRTFTTIFILAILALALSLSVSAESGSGAISSISINSYPDKTVYGAFEQLDTAGLSLTATLDDGSERIIQGKDLRVCYKQGNCLRVGDDSVLLSYGGYSISLPVTVNRISYDLSALKLDGFSTVYNGKYQSYSSLIPNIVGLDGIPLSVNAVGGGSNVGQYDICIDFSTESKDYITPESRIITMTVEPATAEILWSNLSFVYDGRSKSPVASFTDVNGVTVYPAVTGAAINAGAGYIAKVSVNDPNYRFTNTTVSYEIKKADYDFSKVTWSADEFTYDGKKKSISLSGLPAGVSVTGYTGDRATDAGVYTAVALLSWDELNYNTPSTLSHTWEIRKAEYDMSSVGFESVTCSFDGEMHYPRLIGSMPIGADGIQLQYSFSAGAAHVADGVVSVVISFSTASKNYNIPTDRHSSVKITPRGVDITWGELNLTYTGEAQTPTAYANEFSVIVEGGKTVVGKYTAVAKTDNTDYFINNDSVEFIIVRAENRWVEEPTNSVCYEGREIDLCGKSLFGSIEITFYSDPKGENRISLPTSRGKYYAMLSIAETENYTGLKSEIIAFEIIEIVPISFLAQIVKEDLVAFDRLLPGDIICSVLNNDGSIIEIDSSLVSISYERADSLRRGDRSINLRYGEFSLSLPVSVGYADYDMSNVIWQNTEQTYDGTKKYPTLFGLPEGVVIDSYLVSDMVNAGSYTVYVSLGYDSENYNRPAVPPCDFTIKKCPVTIPYISLVYNGKEQAPVSASSLYTVLTSGKYTEAGRYTVSVGLTDPNNYIFAENGGKIANAVFEILPATIKVEVEDVKLRLFEQMSGAEYRIVGGEIYGEDIISVTAYAEGNRVLLRSENPNYIFEVTPGKIIRLPYPTPEGFWVIFSVTVAVLILVFVIVRLYRSKEKLASISRMIRCRWLNRGYKAPMPRRVPEVVRNDSQGFSFELTKNETEPEKDSDSEQPAERESEEREDADFSDHITEFEIDAEKADSLITDSLARSLIKRDGEIIYADGNKKAVLSIEDIGREFVSGQRVDVNTLKEKRIVPPDTAYLKVLGGGVLNKGLSVYANEFSLCAVKMIALAGGRAIKIVTMKEKAQDEKE